MSNDEEMTSNACSEEPPKQQQQKENEGEDTTVTPPLKKRKILSSTIEPFAENISTNSGVKTHSSDDKHENENRLSSGRSFLRSASNEYFTKAWKSGNISNEARNLLHQLLGPSFNIDNSNQNETEQNTCTNSKSTSQIEASILSADSFVAEKGQPEKSVVDQALKGKTSIFCTILRTLEHARDHNKDATDEKAARVAEASFYVPNIALSIRPGDVPADMGAKEFIYSCLAFLCSTRLQSNKKEINGDGVIHSTTAPPLFVEELLDELFPRGEKSLVEVSYDESSSTKFYSLTYSNSIDSDRNLKIKVLRLERAFMASSPLLVSRIKRMPTFKRGEEKSERYLLISGTTAPPRSVPKTKTAAKVNTPSKSVDNSPSSNVPHNSKETEADTESIRSPPPSSTPTTERVEKEDE